MLTKREAAIITIFTGILIGEWSEAHKYAQELTGRPVWTHEFADKEFCEELKKLAKGEFVKIQTGDDLAAENERLKAKLDAVRVLCQSDENRTWTIHRGYQIMVEAADVLAIIDKEEPK